MTLTGPTHLAAPCGPLVSPAGPGSAGAPTGSHSQSHSPAAPAAVPVVVEVLRIGVHHAELRWHQVRTVLLGGQAPDDLARQLAGITDRPAAGIALHSTSWRHTAGEVVLTYAVFPDPHATSAWAPLAEHLAACASPVHPSPIRVDGHHVAAHAVRHLADLAGGRDPHLSACARRQPELWRLLLRHAQGVHVHPGQPWAGPVPP